MNYPQRVISFIIGTIFPIRCLKCKYYINHVKNDYLCEDCFGSITIKKSFECIGCKRSVPLGQTCNLCKATNPLDQLLISTDYTNPVVAELLKIYKYKFIYHAGDQIFKVVKKYLAWLEVKPQRNKRFNLNNETMIIPVPLHKRRFNFRGFNQSEIIAKLIATDCGIEIDDNILVRSKKTKPQVDIKNREERMENIEGVFKVVNTIKTKGEIILLIDDVCTTGATLNACAKVLKNAGAKKVIALVVARG